MRLRHPAGLAAGLLLLAAPPAQAYLDPGSGSLLLQLLLGGVAGLAVLVKLYWQKLLGRLGVRRAEKRGS